MKPTKKKEIGSRAWKPWRDISSPESEKENEYFKPHNARGQSGLPLVEVIQGKDWIGIAPKDVYPVRCHSLFEPYGEEVKTFMNLGYFEEDRAFVEKIHWYPVRPLGVKEEISVKQAVATSS